MIFTRVARISIRYYYCCYIYSPSRLIRLIHYRRCFIPLQWWRRKKKSTKSIKKKTPPPPVENNIRKIIITRGKKVVKNIFFFFIYTLSLSLHDRDLYYGDEVCPRAAVCSSSIRHNLCLMFNKFPGRREYLVRRWKTSWLACVWV